MIYTAMPVLALGTFDKDVDERMSLKFSKLYTPGQVNMFFNRTRFAQSAIHGILTSLVLFGVTLGRWSYNDVIRTRGLDFYVVVWTRGLDFLVCTFLVSISSYHGLKVHIIILLQKFHVFDVHNWIAFQFCTNNFILSFSDFLSRCISFRNACFEFVFHLAVENNFSYLIFCRNYFLPCHANGKNNYLLQNLMHLLLLTN